MDEQFSETDRTVEQASDQIPDQDAAQASKQASNQEKSQAPERLEQEHHSAGRAYPEQYIHTASATVLVLIKLLEGGAAGYALFLFFKALAPLFGELAKGTVEFGRMLQILAAGYGMTIPAELQDLFAQAAAAGLILPFIVCAGFVLVFCAGLVLIVFEAVALLEIRVVKKGAGIVRAIHLIYMWLNIGVLILNAYSIFQYLRTGEILRELKQGGGFLLWQPGIILCVIYILIVILVMCYHKDIAIAMKTVSYELDTGKQGTFKRTHLAGISIFFSIPFVISVIGCVIWLVRGISGGTGVDIFMQSVIRTYGMQAVLALPLSVLLMIKYFCIPACCRNLECARGEQGEMLQRKDKKSHFLRNLIIIVLIGAAAYFAISKGYLRFITDRFTDKTGRTGITTEAQTEGKGTDGQAAAAEEAGSAADGVSADFKEYMDSYEEFMNEYCDFMETYDESDPAALVKYTSLMAKYAEFAEKVEQYDENNLSAEDYKYYLDVMNRVNKRLVEIADSVQ